MPEENATLSREFLAQQRMLLEALRAQILGGEEKTTAAERASREDRGAEQQDPGEKSTNSKASSMPADECLGSDDEEDFPLQTKKLLRGLCLAAFAAFVLQMTQGKAADTELERYKTAERIGQEHLKKFDTLDFDIYSNQKWERFKENHSPDILVHYPDGHTTKGLAAHIAELKPQFVFAPDTRIKEHPVKIESGEWTSVIGVMEGTFSQPMQTPNGPIAPTGKTFKLQMSTVGHWTNGVMDEEYLFWDNQTFMKQIGLAP